MFLLLAGDTYYPLGAEDIKSKHNTLEDAINAIETTKVNALTSSLCKEKEDKCPYEWYQIFDTDTMSIVYP